jgi:hypothetical protein
MISILCWVFRARLAVVRLAVVRLAVVRLAVWA